VGSLAEEKSETCKFTGRILLVTGWGVGAPTRARSKHHRVKKTKVGGVGSGAGYCEIHWCICKPYLLNPLTDKEFGSGRFTADGDAESTLAVPQQG